MTSERDKHKIGLLGATGFVTGSVLGSGIFVAPAIVANQVGSVGMSLVIWLLAPLISTMIAYCYIELGTSIRRSGGNYAYFCYLRWYSVAFSFMLNGSLLAYPMVVVIQADTFTEYAFQGIGIQLESPTAQFYAKRLLGFSLVWLLLFLNFFSVRTVASRFQVIASAAKILALALVIVPGFYYLAFKGGTLNFESPFKGTVLGFKEITTALYAAMYTFDGWDLLCVGIEDIENPNRTLRLALIIGMSLATVLFFATNIAYFAVLSLPEIRSSDAVAGIFADRTLGDFRYAMPLCIAILVIGSLNSTIFGASRYLYAIGRQGQLPSFISCTSEDTQSPRAALIMLVLFSLLVSLLGKLDTLINYLGFCAILQRGLAIVALLYIRFRKVPVHENAIRMTVVLPILVTTIYSAIALDTVVQTWQNAIVSLVVIAVGFVLYYVFVWDKALPRYASYREWMAKINHALCVFTQVVLNGMVHTDEHAPEETKRPPPPRNYGSFSETPRSGNGISNGH